MASEAVHKQTQARSVSFNETGADLLSSARKQELAATLENMKWAVASFSLLGVGCSAGYYFAPAGFFMHNFKNENPETFFLWMVMALYLPYPIIMLLQEKFDEGFDSMFGPRQTYFFRVIAIQMMLACVYAGYSLCGESPTGVLVCGVLIGCFTAAVHASTMQLMSAWDPYLTSWASLGKDVAGAVPVVTYFLRGFEPSSATLWEFQTMQLFPLVLICLCAVCCTGLHSAGIWDKAYSRLGYDLWDVNSDDGPKQRQVSESDPLLDMESVDSSGQPLWTPKWQLAYGFNTCLSFILMPLVPSLGSADLTQKLILAKLAMDCLGRCVAAVASNTEVFGIAQPRHYLLAAQAMVKTALFVPLLAHILGHVMLPVNTFVFLWLVHFFIGCFIASQIDVTTVRFAPVALRKGISRRSSLANFSGLAFGLAVDIVIIFVL